MYRILFIFFLFVGVVSPLGAEEHNSAIEDYDFVVQVLREDYAGFEDKTAGDQSQAFEAEAEKHRRAISAKPDAFLSETRALLGWFRDKHLWIYPLAGEETGSNHSQMVDEFSLTQLSPKTLLLRLPDFAAENREKIEALLAANEALLSRTPNLLIDIRNNSGGADSSYSELLKWIYSRPIYSVGVGFRTSARNARLFREVLDESAMSDSDKAVVQRLVDGMSEPNPSPWIFLPEKPLQILVLPETRPFPKRVALLIAGAGSSGEQFVLDARQSRKVTTFGAPTAGVLDYSNQLGDKSPSGKYMLLWATSRSLRLPEEPIDNIGIAPDIPLGPEVGDQIVHVQNWLERQAD